VLCSEGKVAVGDALLHGLVLVDGITDLLFFFKQKLTSQRSSLLS
jgi:hypothetical protein